MTRLRWLLLCVLAMLCVTDSVIANGKLTVTLPAKSVVVLELQ